MKLIVVTNDCLPVEKLSKTLRAIEPYIDAVILREKSKSEAEIHAILQLLKKEGFPTEKVTVHANATLAKENGIRSVQLPGNSKPLAQLHREFPNLSFGKSIHSLSEAKEAEEQGASSVLYGHLFPTASKPGFQPRGTAELREIIAAIKIPTYVIGGIQPEHIETLKTLEIGGVAIMSSIWHAEDPVEKARQYRNAMDKGGIKDGEDN